MSPFTTLLKTAKSKPQPYHVQVPTERIDELKQLVRLSKIGPETYENVHAITEEGGMGLTRAWLVRAREEWGGGWDWKTVEDEINSFPNYTTEIEGITLHFVAMFSEKQDAVPILLSHGWPGSFLEFLPLLTLFRTQYTPSTLPFHLIVPSLPGYAFSSGPPTDRNFTMAEVANILNTLMVQLGFGEKGYIAQGGDIGSRVSRILGARYAECRAVHLNFCIMPRPEHIPLDSLDERERKQAEKGIKFVTSENAYAKEHASRPATIGLILSSSPLALLGWIGEKFIEWTDTTPSLHEILASVSLYWLTDTFPRSIYPYRESYGPEPTHHGTQALYIDKPLGYSYFPHEVFPVPISWVETTGKLCWHRVHDKGGHFAAMEQPEAFKKDLEDFVAQVWN